MGVLTMSSARALKFIWPNLGEPAFERKFLSAEVPPLKTSNTLTMTRSPIKRDDQLFRLMKVANKLSFWELSC